MRIDIDDLRVAYGETVAIDALSLKLEAGKIYGLLGRNGAGKTSLLSVLAGFRRHSGGTVLADGRPIFENSHTTREISLIRDAGETVNLGTVEDALYFAEDLRPRWDAAYAQELIELFELDPKKNVKSMSKGQRSAVGVVVGLASRAPLTMFDESYLGMDVPSRQAFYDALLADFMAHPRTIILSTHLIEEVSSLFEEVVIIDKGRLVVHTPADDLLAMGTPSPVPPSRSSPSPVTSPSSAPSSWGRPGPSWSTARSTTPRPARRVWRPAPSPCRNCSST